MVTLKRRVARNGMIADLRKARNQYVCIQCVGLIEAGERYYSVTYAGAGLGSIKFPDRCHQDCVEEYLNSKGGGR